MELEGRLKKEVRLFFFIFFYFFRTEKGKKEKLDTGREGVI